MSASPIDKITRDSDVATVLEALEELGTEQNRKVYPRHGITSPMSGVSFGNLSKICKKLGRNNALAEGLWQSGHADARHLATNITDPKTMARDLIENWVNDIRYYLLSDLIARDVTSPRDDALEIAAAWMARSEEEWVARAGWATLSSYLAVRKKGADRAFLTERVAIVEKRIHSAPNRVRDAMTGALVAIGLSREELEPLVLDTAARIGPVEVDHGETGCRTSNPLTDIPRAKAQIAKRKAKAAEKAAAKAKAKNSAG